MEGVNGDRDLLSFFHIKHKNYSGKKLPCIYSKSSTLGNARLWIVHQSLLSYLLASTVSLVLINWSHTSCSPPGLLLLAVHNTQIILPEWRTNHNFVSLLLFSVWSHVTFLSSALKAEFLISSWAFPWCSSLQCLSALQILMNLSSQHFCALKRNYYSNLRERELRQNKLENIHYFWQSIWDAYELIFQMV